MFMILHETGEYSDYSIRMLGYVTEESKAQEIIAKKNEELKKLIELKEKYDNFNEKYDIKHPFKWSDTISAYEEDELKAYDFWSQEKNGAIHNWFAENGLNKEESRQIRFLYGDNYLYRKIEEYQD